MIAVSMGLYILNRRADVSSCLISLVNTYSQPEARRHADTDWSY